MDIVSVLRKAFGVPQERSNSIQRNFGVPSDRRSGIARDFGAPHFFAPVRGTSRCGVCGESETARIHNAMVTGFEVPAGRSAAIEREFGVPEGRAAAIAREFGPNKR